MRMVAVRGLSAVASVQGHEGMGSSRAGPRGAAAEAS